MKKTKIVMLSLMLVCTLVGCNRNANPETEKKLFLTEVLKTMRENDSFKLNTVNKKSVNEEEMVNEEISFLINNYYDDATREAYMRTITNIEGAGEVNVRIFYKNQVTNVYMNEEHQGSMFEFSEMYADLEYLKLDKKDIDTIKIDDNKRKVTFTLNAEDPSIFDRLFATEEMGSEEVSMIKCKYEFILNKDNTIKQSKRVAEFKSEGETLVSESEVNVLNYKKQKIELPS